MKLAVLGGNNTTRTFYTENLYLGSKKYFKKFALIATQLYVWKVFFSKQ